MSLSRRLTLLVVALLGVCGAIVAFAFYGSIRQSLDAELAARLDARLDWLERSIRVESDIRLSPGDEPRSAAEYWEVTRSGGGGLWGSAKPRGNAALAARSRAVAFSYRSESALSVPLERVPQTVLAAVENHLPGFVPHAAQARLETRQPAYRLLGVLEESAYEVDVELRPSATVRKIDVHVIDTGRRRDRSEAAPERGLRDGDDERVLELADLPGPVRETIRRVAADLDVETVQQIASQGRLLYRVDADTAEADVDLAVAPDGMLIEKEVDLDREDEEIPLAETPAAVRETIRRELGDLAPRITTKLRRGKLVYEVDAAVQGRGIEINVFEDGSVRNKYVDIDLADAPDPVRRAVEEALGDLPVDEVRRFVSGGTVLYEVEAEADGKEIELEFAPDGTAVDHDGSDVFPRYPLPDGEGELRLLLSASALTAEMDAELARFGRALLVVGPLALLACGLVLALLIRWQLRPLARMARQASGIGPANLRERIGPVGSSEECARLREAINSMIERLAEGLEREQRFAASAAHELRTPIAQLKTATEVAFLSERDASEYRQVLRENLDDIDRLEKLVTALLELSRRRHATEVRGRPVSLRALLVRTLEAYEGVSFPEELRRQDILVEGDADLLRAALSNVIDNARRYAPGAPPTIDLQTAGDVVVLVVADRGPGVGPADRERIFEPLARLQPAPAAAAAGAPRPDPGFGLGLAVARSTLRAFGGDLGCRARRDGEAGAEFVFSFRRTRLPAEASPGSRREH